MNMLIGIVLLLAVIVSLFSILKFTRSQKKPTDRLEKWMSTYQEPDIPEEKPERRGLLSQIGAFAEKLRIGHHFMERTRIELVRADIPLTGYEFNIFRSFLVVVVGALCWLFAKSLIGVVLLSLVVWVAADVYVSAQKAKRLKLFGTQLGDALTLFSNSLRAGFSFLQAVNSVAREMPDPIAKEFTIMMKEMSLGLSVEKSLSNLLIRVPLDDLELLVLAILIQKEVGGNLAEIIDTIATTIRERITIQLEVKALTAQGKMSGVVIGLLPIALGLGIYAINPPYMSILFIEPMGRVLVAAGIFNMVIGIFLISKIVKIEV